jgi:hypothetical protein
MHKVVAELQRTQINPLLKESYLCSAACVDNAKEDEFQAWCAVEIPDEVLRNSHTKQHVNRYLRKSVLCSIDRCEQRAHAAKVFIDSRLQDFQVCYRPCSFLC